MRVIFSFDREKPFADVERHASDELVDRYADALAGALRDHYPEHDIEVHPIDEANGDVVFVPEDALTSAERLELALDVRRVARRLADLMLPEGFTASAKT